MERFLSEVLGGFLVSGALGAYAFITVILLVVFYFKYLKPYLADFEEIKSFLRTIPAVHDRYDKNITKIFELIKDNYSDNIVEREKKLNELILDNNKAHGAIGTEFGKMKYLIEELSRKDEKFYDKNNDSFSKILLELTKLETRLEYQNGPTLGGIRK